MVLRFVINVINAKEDLKMKSKQIKKVGRPRKIINKGGRLLFDGKDYNTVLQKLEYAWALGISDAIASKFAKISPAALSDFLKKNSAISERKEELKSSPLLKAHKSVIDSFADNPDIAFRYLERKLRKEFGPSQKIEHSGHISNADLSEAQIDERFNKIVQRMKEKRIKKIEQPNPEAS